MYLHQIRRECLWLQKPVCAKFWPHFEKQMAAIANFLKIIKVLKISKYSRQVNQICTKAMTRKASLIVILA